jgi:type I restriction enzyme S subunit
MIDELPQGWCDAGLTEVAEVFLGKTPARTDYTSSGSLKVVKFRDIHDGRVDFSNTKDGFVQNNRDALSGLRELRAGDVLITSAAHSGENIGKKCAYVSSLPDEFSRVFFTGELLNIRCLDDTLSRWAYLFFRSVDGFSEIQEAVTGVHLTGGRAKQMRLPVAPLPEQRQIVAKLEKLLEKVDASQQRLAKIPVLLKRFRQAVLAAACSGRLTADWRERNGCDDFESTTVDAIADYVGGFAYKSPTFLEVGKHQVIRIGNVRPLALKLDASPVYIPDDIAEQTQRFKLLPGDIVISMTGTKYKQDYGFAAFVIGSDGSLFLNQRVARIRCGKSVLPKFLLFWFQTDLFREFFFSGETGNVNQGNVGAGGIRHAPIELPPLAEQQEIVRRVQALFALADQIEARYAKGKAHVKKLTQSILAKAFRGELVPQDPNDEPAEGLLRRIRQQRKNGKKA